MVRDLVDQAVNLVKAAKKEQVKEKAALAVEEIILDALIPPLRPQAAPKAPGFAPAQESTATESDVELNERTRNLFREKIRNGELDGKRIDSSIKETATPGIDMVGAGVMDEVYLMNLQEMLNGMLPQKTRKRKVTVAEARRILLEEEAAKLI